jgi:hypothetical protein
VVFAIRGVSAAQEDSGAKSIRITKESFSEIYPAVWFSPSDGSIAPLTERSEKPPKTKFKIWIEPSDPEIATLEQESAEEGNQGFQLIGHGETHFMNPVLPTQRDLVSRVRAEDLEKPLAVLLYVEGKRSYVMFVESISTDRQELVFRWKALPPD